MGLHTMPSHRKSFVSGSQVAAPGSFAASISDRISVSPSASACRTAALAERDNPIINVIGAGRFTRLYGPEFYDDLRDRVRLQNSAPPRGVRLLLGVPEDVVARDRAIATLAHRGCAFLINGAGLQDGWLDRRFSAGSCFEVTSLEE